MGSVMGVTLILPPGHSDIPPHITLTPPPGENYPRRGLGVGLYLCL